MMAIRQFQQATSMALEQKKYLSALRNSVKAEKSLKKLFKELNPHSSTSHKKLSGLSPSSVLCSWLRLPLLLLTS
jgi:hypothetical protein